MILAYLKRLFSNEFVVFYLSVIGITFLLASILGVVKKIPNIEKVLSIIAIVSIWTLLGLLAIGLIISFILIVRDFLEFRRNYKEAKKAGAKE